MSKHSSGSDPKPRYDAVAQWYDRGFAAYADLDDERSSASTVARLLGPGEGLCLDVGCGTGLHFRAIESTGRVVVGLDLSSGQLRIARGRSPLVLRASATCLPFCDAAFSTIVCTYLHTDVDDMYPVFREVERVLAAEGRFVYVGVHPCFEGHFVQRRQDGSRVIHPRYLESGWHTDSEFWRPNGLRRQVGERHTTVSGLINALLESGLALTRVVEPDNGAGSAEQFAMVAAKAGGYGGYDASVPRASSRDA
jgi:ubiquinone/menaquinone biosynthesis C-methylase UbiE